uniref:uncharacterized protein LOC120338432 isoform X2 n=1 Tax=Styela clava TaxID=7725 RepID=UPI00193AC401|nr:uncharacterized protein LOC120338432 isoform X2 [Styela clava]
MGDIQPEVNSTTSDPSFQEEISNQLPIQECADQRQNDKNSQKPTPDVPNSLINEPNQKGSNSCVRCEGNCKRACIAAGRPESARAAEQVVNGDSDSDSTGDYVRSSQPQDVSQGPHLAEIEQEEQKNRCENNDGS